MTTNLTPGPIGREVLLLLPGMTLNETIFPDLGLPAIALDANALAAGADGGGVVQERMGYYVRLLDGFLAARPEWDTAEGIVVAHSFGGMLALQWLAEGDRRRTSRVRGLVLISTSPGPLFDAVRLRVGRILGRDLRVPLAPFLGIWNRPFVTRCVKRALTGGRLGAERVDFSRLRCPTDAALDRAGWRNTDWRAMRSYRLALEGMDLRPLLPRIEVAVIVLHGDRDSLLPLSGARELAERLPNAELRIVAGAAHGLPLTHPEAVRGAVADVIGRMGG